MRTWVAIIGSASAIGSAIGLGMVYIAVQHNPQGEVIDQVTGVPDYAYLAVLFLSWFLPVGAAAGLVLTLVAWAVSGLRGREGATK